MGVNLITVCNGTFVYGRSSNKHCRSNTIVIYIKTKFSRYLRLYQENKPVYNVQQLDDKQQEHSQLVLIPL